MSFLCTPFQCPKYDFPLPPFLRREEILMGIIYRCCHSLGSDMLAARWKNRARKDDVTETMIATMKQTIWVG